MHSFKHVFPVMSEEANHLDREKAGKWLWKRVKSVKYLNLKFAQPKDLAKILKEKVIAIQSGCTKAVICPFIFF